MTAKENKDTKTVQFSNLPWNGGYLGKIKRSNVIEDHAVSGSYDHIWVLKLQEKFYYVQARTAKDNYACIIDQLKPVFGLLRIGTHCIKINSKFWILSRITAILDPESKEWRCEPDCRDVDSKIMEKEWFQQQVSAIFAFRYLVGVKQSFDRHIKYKVLHYTAPMVFSSHDISCCFPNNNKISTTVIGRWFKESDDRKCDALTVVMERLLWDPLADSDVTQLQRIMSFQKEIESSIKACDVNWLWITDHIVGRIRDHLTHIESYKVKSES
jgi:hypothetical protein